MFIILQVLLIYVIQINDELLVPGPLIMKANNGRGNETMHIIDIVIR